ncbi:hypothetical protein GUITHDRAFT_101331 [Guillardia theta CCMP2712]|uniref:HMG box domain-containing protein n=1 Tax=Guillardia theta (strain CCMP2712) TaxID=905079 RepID=L1JXR5_GUITC|nr:hypothetical protein GUITHDRAFT_101331 [Guillardia theta CCMP2712]EKX52878.1 hypothetical protein GUITHDRAFT_101331 [Guillardia theta CCMP2712]|eukprot:XP_005839858.1 hypothetical protein GUITHDRAFT_101331 [Guillardia theta CCMP2712]
MAPTTINTVISIITSDFQDVIDKKELIQVLKTKQAEIKKEAKNARADRPPTAYNVYMWEKMKSEDLANLKPKERMSVISKQWKDDAEQYKADKAWYDRASEEMRQEKDAKKTEDKDTSKDAEKEAKKAEKEAEKEAKKAEKEAEKEAKKAEKEAAKEAKKAAKEAEKEAKKAAKEAEKEAKKAAKTK